MKDFVVTFTRIETYEVEVKAANAAWAEKQATAMIVREPEAYLVNDEGLDCVQVEEV
jgi:hypothetical protein